MSGEIEHVTEESAMAFVAAAAGEGEGPDGSFVVPRVVAPTLREILRDMRAAAAIASLQSQLVVAMQAMMVAEDALVEKHLSGLEELMSEAPLLAEVTRAHIEEMRDVRQGALERMSLGPSACCDGCGARFRVDLDARKAQVWTPLDVARWFTQAGLHIVPRGGLDGPAPQLCATCRGGV